MKTKLTGFCNIGKDLRGGRDRQICFGQGQIK